MHCQFVVFGNATKKKKQLLVLLYILFQTVCKAVIPHKYILFFAKILGIPHDVT